IVVECAATAGTKVDFSATAASRCTTVPPTITFNPASGSLFSLGRAVVNCVAADDKGNTATCVFNVTVVDKTGPAITVPTGIVVPCAGPSGASVKFDASAHDLCDPNPTVVCTPQSGSVFPVGTTTVTCTAADSSGNTSSKSFSVMVNS